jgi:hypothetical protein
MTQPDNTPLSHYFAQVQAMPMNEAVSGKFLYELLPYWWSFVSSDPDSCQGRDTTSTLSYFRAVVTRQLQPQVSQRPTAGHALRNFMRLTQGTGHHQSLSTSGLVLVRMEADDIDSFTETNIDRDIITSFEEAGANQLIASYRHGDGDQASTSKPRWRRPISFSNTLTTGID